MSQRDNDNTALLAYKALHDATAAYLVDDCQLVSHPGRRRLRSADIDTCCPTDQHTVRRPELCSRWIAALEQSAGQDRPIRQPDNDTGEFRRQLKSFLFK